MKPARPIDAPAREADDPRHRDPARAPDGPSAPYPRSHRGENDAGSRPRGAHEPEPEDEDPDDAEAGPGGEPSESEDEGEEESENKPIYKRPVPVIVIALLLLAGGAYGAYYYIFSMNHTWTDDAFIDGNISHIAPRVAGQVQRVAVDDNQYVKAGDLLVKLDPSTYQADLTRARAAAAATTAQLAQAKAALPVARANADQARSQKQEAQANADYAAKQARRTRDMFQRHAMSRQDLDRANTRNQSAAAALGAAKQKVISSEAKVKQAQSEVASAGARVKQAQARVARDKLDLSYTTITAPIDGRVTKSDLVEGDYVEAGQSLLAIVQPGVWVKANFKEPELTDVRPGQPVNIVVDAFPDHTFKGTVDSIQSGTGSRFSLLPPENATGNYVKVVQRVPVKITFNDPPDPDRYLLVPGMSVVPTVDITGHRGTPMRGIATPPPTENAHPGPPKPVTESR